MRIRFRFRLRLRLRFIYAILLMLAYEGENDDEGADENTPRFDGHDGYALPIHISHIIPFTIKLFFFDQVFCCLSTLVVKFQMSWKDSVRSNPCPMLYVMGAQSLLER